MKIIFYKNSALATIISLFGCSLLITGVVLVVSISGILYGIPMALVGMGLNALARKISENKAYKTLFNDFRQNGVENMMIHSTDACLEVYKQNLYDKRIKEYIISLNPQAALALDAYENSLKNNQQTH